MRWRIAVPVNQHVCKGGDKLEHDGHNPSYGSMEELQAEVRVPTP